jgi:hypothetical protein
MRRTKRRKGRGVDFHYDEARNGCLQGKPRLRIDLTLPTKEKKEKKATMFSNHIITSSWTARANDEGKARYAGDAYSAISRGLEDELSEVGLEFAHS